MSDSTTPVWVGISGGVDSSVAALRLLEAGHAVEGLFMKNWEEDDEPGHCSAAEDLADARAVCERLGIPLHTVNFSAEYWDRVFEHFLREYAAGRTPNPDVLCNREIKFRAFLDYALEHGAGAIATGHYARVAPFAGRHALLKGIDPTKDQSYFLYLLGQRALSRSLFPLGGLHKSEVRRIAERAGFPNAGKKDSTGICFIGERRFREFLARYLPARPGPMVTVDGREIGTHQGLMYYTIGQRQGLGIGGVKGAGEAPWYVVEKRLEENMLVVAQGEHPRLYRDRLEARELHWIAGEPPPLPLRCSAKIRYRQADQACRVVPLERDEGVEVLFETPQRAVTPGQSVVFYEGDRCLGGGIIQ